MNEEINITSDEDDNQPFDVWVKGHPQEGLLRIERDLCKYLEVVHAATYLRNWNREIGPRILGGWSYDQLLESYGDLLEEQSMPNGIAFYKRMIEIVTYLKDHVKIETLKIELSK